MRFDTFFVEKRTNTSADILEAFGLAYLLTTLKPADIYGPPLGLTLSDAGSCYTITLDQALAPEWIDSARFQHLMPGLTKKGKGPDLPPAYVVDYDKQGEIRSQYFEARKAIKDRAELENLQVTLPSPDWSHWATIYAMFANSAYNSMVEAWYAHRECYSQLMRMILENYRSFPNPSADFEAAWKELVNEKSLPVKPASSLLQIVNPGMGKGQNKRKAAGLSISGLKGFWIPEYFKFLGFYKAAIPRYIRGSNDLKIYIPRPQDLSWRTYQRVHDHFRRDFFASTSIKMDILAVLRYCQTYLEQWIAGQDTGDFSFEPKAPGDHIAALEAIYYKKLKALVTMNIGSLRLPAWLDVRNVQDAEALLDIIREHLRVVSGLDPGNDGKKDQDLLRIYRQFLSSRAMNSFFDFTQKYANHILSQLNQSKSGGRRPAQFSASNLEVLIMSQNPSLGPIFEDEGFVHLADAIRLSTLVPQYQKANNQKPLYQIRYGLGDELLRHAQYSDQFLKALGKFAYDYNHENVQKNETRHEQRRRNITTDDLKAITALVDKYGSDTIAHLLVAFGFARSPRDPEPDPADESEQEEE